MTRPHLSNSLELARKHHLLEFEIGSLLELAFLHLHLHDPAAANPLLVAAEQLAQDTNNKRYLAETTRYKAQMQLAAGQPEAALDEIARALALVRELEDSHEEGLNLRIQAQVLLAEGQIEAALAGFERSLELLVDDPYEAACTQVQYTLALRASGDEERTNALLEQAQAAFARLGAKRDLAEVEALLAG
jgi:ATP/maltotriose-dependent transcriptional regulator MalT